VTTGLSHRLGESTHSVGVGCSESSERIVLKLDDNSARKALNDGSFKTNKTSSTVVSQYSDAFAAGDVELA